MGIRSYIIRLKIMIAGGIVMGDEVLVTETLKAKQGILNEFLSVFDKFGAEKKHKADSTYGFLSDNLLVHSIVVSPNLKSGLSSLKTFFATEAMEIYKGKQSSKISYKNIQEHLEGSNNKKYRFSYEVLEKIMQKEINKDAFLNEARIMRSNTDMCEMIKEYDDWLPYILLDQLRKTAWEMLDKYNQICIEAEEDTENRKKLLYYQFTQAVAMFEMFMIEYVKKPLRKCIQKELVLIEKIKETAEKLKIWEESIQEKVVRISGQMEDKYHMGSEIQHDVMTLVAEYNLFVSENIEELTGNTNKISILHLVEAEFGVELCAMLHLLLVLEAVNVYEENMDSPQIGANMDCAFMGDYDKFFVSFGRTNENKRADYRRVNTYLDNLLSEYAGKPYDVKKTVIAFLQELSTVRTSGETEQFYGFLCALAYPVYRKLGGEI